MAKKSAPAKPAATATQNPDADLLADAGRALYGEQQWRSLLAQSLGVKPDTVSAWLKGKLELTAEHDVMRRTLNLLITRRDAADRVARQIARLIGDPGAYR